MARIRRLSRYGKIDPLQTMDVVQNLPDTPADQIGTAAPDMNRADSLLPICRRDLQDPVTLPDEQVDILPPRLEIE